MVESMEYAVPVILGIIAGAIGFVPMLVALRLSRKNATSSIVRDAALYGLGGVCVSLLVVVVELIVCALVARPQVLPFGVSELLALIAVTALYVVASNRTRNRVGREKERLGE